MAVGTSAVRLVGFHLRRFGSVGLLAAMKSFFSRRVVLVLAGSISLLGRAETQPPPPTATNLWVVTFPGYQNSSSSTPAVAPEGTVYVGTFLGDFMA